MKNVRILLILPLSYRFVLLFSHPSVKKCDGDQDVWICLRGTVRCLFFPSSATLTEMLTSCRLALPFPRFLMPAFSHATFPPSSSLSVSSHQLLQLNPSPCPPSPRQPVLFRPFSSALSSKRFLSPPYTSYPHGHRICFPCSTFHS